SNVTVLSTGLATEVTTRTSQVAALSTGLSTTNSNVATLSTGLSTTNANLAAETNARVAMGAELRDRIASSTATAIALGGAAILPDANFTLSGNVGFYQGAQAIALNAAARVAPNTFLTGAVGGGLNKHGELGGRVGFVFGF